MRHEDTSSEQATDYYHIMSLHKRQTKNETFAYIGQPFKTFKAVGDSLNCFVFTSFGAVESNRVTLVHKITYNKMGY